MFTPISFSSHTAWILPAFIHLFFHIHEVYNLSLFSFLIADSTHDSFNYSLYKKHFKVPNCCHFPMSVFMILIMLVIKWYKKWSLQCFHHSPFKLRSLRWKRYKKRQSIWIEFILNFLAVPYGVWDLSSLTKDPTCTPWSGSVES